MKYGARIGLSPKERERESIETGFCLVVLYFDTIGAQSKMCSVVDVLSKDAV